MGLAPEPVIQRDELKISKVLHRVPTRVVLTAASASSSASAPVMTNNVWLWRSVTLEKSRIQFDLGAETAIDQVLLKTGHWEYPNRARIEISMDGSVWNSVAERDNLGQLLSLFNHSIKTSRHLRIAVNRYPTPTRVGH